MPASPAGGGVWATRSAQGRWTQEESRLPINILELRAIKLRLFRWSLELQGRPVRIQSDNATAVAYVNHQGGTRSSAAATEVAHILRWAERSVPALSAVYIPGVQNWQADFLSRTTLDQGEWFLHPEGFQNPCQKWGTPDVDLMASRLNRKVPRFVARSKDPWADASDVPFTEEWLLSGHSTIQA